MHPFEYYNAKDPQDATKTASGNIHSRYLAGGTTLVDLMKLNVETPSQLVYIDDLPLTQIQELPDGGVRVGAMVKNSDLAWHPIIEQRYPLLSKAILQGASAQLRNMATTGGNVLQRTRCYYFRDTTQACNKREPGTGCAAIEGYNRVNAILGTNENCIASNPSDMNVAMIALDAAILTTGGPNGDRRIPYSQFYTLPGDHPEIETVLQHGEMITAVDLPALPWAKRSDYLKVRDRASYAFALASAAVALNMSGSTITEARIAMGGVGYIPWRATEAEAALAGKPANDDNFRAAAEAALAGAKGYKNNAFKIELAKRTVVRALQTVSAMTA